MTAGLRVLVADDHPVHRVLLRNLFGAFGCSVTVANDGLEALSHFERCDFDLVCLDRHMPGLGGCEVARSMAGRTYLVSCTSDPSPGVEVFDTVMAKPIRAMDIVEAVTAASRMLGRCRRRVARGGGCALGRDAEACMSSGSVAAA